MMPPSFVVMLQRTEAGGDLLLERRDSGSRSPASCSIVKLIERHVAVEGADDPVAIGPNLAVVVEMDAVRVGVAGHVEPVPAAMLAPVRRLHQPIDQLLVGVGRLVVDECLDQLPAPAAGRSDRGSAGGRACGGRPPARATGPPLRAWPARRRRSGSSPRRRSSPPAAAAAIGAISDQCG